ncbi:MAG: methyltransferase domain-containing protein [Sphingomonadales bacterium]|nr:MAG: methyltransferase domain-containing protein [Sphingomonadales bacterium]
MHMHFSFADLLHPVRSFDRGVIHHGPSMARITAALAERRREGRRSIRILDLECGDGERLLRTAACARELGFVAIEGVGVDLSVGRIRHARREAQAQAHHSTRLEFQVAEAMAALAVEQDGAADLILMCDAQPYPASPLAIALARVSVGPVLGAP